MRNDTEGRITAVAACPVPGCRAAAGQACRDTRTGHRFGQIVHTERLKAAECRCLRVQPGGEGPWIIAAVNPSCLVHGDEAA